jgi:hypothetical protein
MSNKTKVLDLDALESQSLEVKFGGETYIIEEMGVKQVYKLMKAAEDYENANKNLMENPTNEAMSKALDSCMKELIYLIIKENNPSITKEALDELSAKKLETMSMQLMQFIGSAFTPGRDNGI